MSRAIRIPVVDPDQPLTRQAIADLPKYLGDAEDAAVCRQLLEIAWRAVMPATTTIGTIAEMLEGSDPNMRKFFREGCEKLAGITEARAEREREERERAARLKLARQPSQPVPRPDGCGWYDPSAEAAEALRIEAELTSRRRQREAEQQQRQLEADHRGEYERARDAARNAELPEHLRPR